MMYVDFCLFAYWGRRVEGVGALCGVCEDGGKGGGEVGRLMSCMAIVVCP